jgi:hypothetical protein
MQPSARSIATRFQPKKLVEWKGKTQSIPAWSKETGIDKQVLYNRLIQHEQGKRTLEEVFEPSPKHLKPNKDERELGRRCLETFLQSFITYCLPKLNAEMKKAAETGVEGHVMKLFDKYARFFTADTLKDKHKKETISTGVMAQYAVIVQPGATVPNLAVKND